MASLSDVVKGIQSTNELLVQNVKGQNRTAAMITAFVTGQQSSFGDRLEAGREKGKSTKATAQPVKGSGGGGFKSGFMKGSGLGSLLGIGSRIVGAIFAGAAGVALLSSIAGVITGKLVLGAIAVGLIRAFGVGAIDKVFEMLDPKDIFFTEKQQEEITASFMTNLQIGMLAFLVNKQFGAAVFLGLLLKDLALSMFDEKNRIKLKEKILKGQFENKFMQAFADNFTLENLAGLGGIIASFFGLGLLTGAIRQAFTGSPKGGPSGAKVKPRFGGLFRKAMGARLGLALMLPALGTAIGAQIETLTGDEDLAKIASVGMNAVVIAGMIGGPYAALIAAIAVLATMGMNYIIKNLTKTQEEFENDIKAKQLELRIKKFEEGLSPEEEARLRFIDRKALETNPTNLAQSLNNEAMAKILRRARAQGIGLRGLGGMTEDDFTYEAGKFAGQTYTGKNDALNPFPKNSRFFKLFKQRAKLAAIVGAASDADTIGMRADLSNPMISTSGNSAQPGPFGSLSTFGRNEQNLELAIKMIASNARAIARLAAVSAAAIDKRNEERGNNMVVVAGNQKVNSLDTAIDPRLVRWNSLLMGAGGGKVY